MVPSWGTWYDYLTDPHFAFILEPFVPHVNRYRGFDPLINWRILARGLKFGLFRLSQSSGL